MPQKLQQQTNKIVTTPSTTRKSTISYSNIIGDTSFTLENNKIEKLRSQKLSTTTELLSSVKEATATTIVNNANSMAVSLNSVSSTIHQNDSEENDGLTSRQLDEIREILTAEDYANCRFFVG